ncbi:MAG: sulfotransferase [Phycisphaerae bacterium]|nr:sulfotransferase [Phycisphaerae bacterium]
MNPRDRSLLIQAVNAFNAGDVDRASDHCAAYLKVSPKCPEGWRLCARIRTRQSKWDAAADALVKARTFAPGEVSIVVAQAQLLLRRGQHAEAIACLEREYRRAEAHVELRRTLAEAYRRAGNLSKALATIQSLDDAESRLIEGEILANLGDAQAAELALAHGLAQSPDAHVASRLHWRLGELRERQNDLVGAFEHFAQSKAATPARFDWATFRAQCERIRACFTSEQFARWAPSTVRSRRPVFIAGLPRSGTTLLERQIAAHPSGAGAGETEALNAQVESWRHASVPSACWPLFCRGFLARDFELVAQTYLQHTDVYAGPGVERIADKHLSNWLHVGLIAAVFPQATIIDLERDPMDTGLSCFERLQNSAMPWAASLDGVGEMLAHHDAMMQHWRRVLPGRLVHLRYEDLVRDTRTHLGAVLEATGVPWNDGCLAHHASRSGRREPPPTLAAEQVALPVYDSSIGRAARFENLLAPMRSAYERVRAALA